MKPNACHDLDALSRTGRDAARWRCDDGETWPGSPCARLPITRARSRRNWHVPPYPGGSCG